MLVCVCMLHPVWVQLSVITWSTVVSDLLVPFMNCTLQSYTWLYTGKAVSHAIYSIGIHMRLIIPILTDNPCLPLISNLWPQTEKTTLGGIIQSSSQPDLPRKASASPLQMMISLRLTRPSSLHWWSPNQLRTLVSWGVNHSWLLSPL